MIELYVNLNESGDIVDISTISGNLKVVSQNPEINFKKLSGYKIETKDMDPNNYLVFDENKYNAYMADIERERALNECRQAMENLSKSIVLKAASDDQAYAMRYLYDAFNPEGYPYLAGDRFMYDNRFYKVLQDHVSQAEWTPDTAASLYVEISDPAEQWPEWKQPVSAETAYALGAQVTYAGQKYISQIASNTAEPGSDERWWKEVDE